MTTDIRKGDLVKATLKQDPEESSTFRVKYVDGGHDGYESTGGYFFPTSYFDFEVLERPIDEELLKGAIDTYRGANGSHGATYDDLYPYQQEAYRRNIKAVIQFVRDYDKKDSK